MSLARLWSQIHVDQLTYASAASDGANARLIQAGPFGREGRLKAVYITPTGGDQGANAASYRRFSVYNGGTAGTATATASRLASYNFSASAASLGPVAGTIVYPATGTAAASGTFGSADVLYVSQETVGGAHATGTVLRAGQVALQIEFIG